MDWKNFFTGLYHRLILSYKSTFLGLLVAIVIDLLGQAQNYPNQYVHLIATLIAVPFLTWKDKAVAEGTIKLIGFLILASALGAQAQTPSARRAQAAIQSGTLADVAPSDPPHVTAPKFGGCLKSGFMCFGPSIAITGAAINVTKGTVEGAFSPGVGYGLVINPAEWYAFGADLAFILDPGAQQASGSLILKFAGYIRIGVSKGFIGDKSVRIPLGVGVDL